jgi:SAM-dependent methyltransferase
MQAAVYNPTLRWRALSMFMSTVGRLSNGVDLGYRYGFDSGEMLDYVYENRARGRLGIGALIDRVYLNSVGWRGIRSRKRVLKRVLGHEIGRVRERVMGPARVLDVASGPGRYLLELCEEMRERGQDPGARVQIVCRDMDEAGLEQGRRRAAELGLTNVRYEPGDATSAHSLNGVLPRPDLVVVSGLYELFTDAATIRRSMEAIHGILPPGGGLVFTTQVSHPQLELIANVLVNREGRPWVMGCRTVEEAESLARDAGFKVVSTEVEPVGLFAVTVCRRA